MGEKTPLRLIDYLMRNNVITVHQTKKLTSKTYCPVKTYPPLTKLLQQKALKCDALKYHALKNYIENPRSVTFMIHRNRICISSTTK